MNAIMTRAEREDLQAARPPARKSAETSNQTTIGGLVADFENQMGSEYSFDQDKVWRQAAEAAEREVSKAQRVVAARCHELGIPDRFAPSLHLTRGYDNRIEDGARNCAAWRKPKLRQTNSGRSFKSKYPASTPKRS